MLMYSSGKTDVSFMTQRNSVLAPVMLVLLYSIFSVRLIVENIER